MCTHTCTCTSTDTVQRVRGLSVRPFSMTPPCRQPHSIFGGVWISSFLIPKQSYSPSVSGTKKTCCVTSQIGTGSGFPLHTITHTKEYSFIHFHCFSLTWFSWCLICCPVNLLRAILPQNFVCPVWFSIHLFCVFNFICICSLIFFMFIGFSITACALCVFFQHLISGPLTPQTTSRRRHWQKCREAATPTSQTCLVISLPRNTPDSLTSTNSAPVRRRVKVWWLACLHSLFRKYSVTVVFHSAFEQRNVRNAFKCRILN